MTSHRICLQFLDHYEGLPQPRLATEGSSGYDLLSAAYHDLVLTQFSTVLVPTGIAIQLPSGCEAQIRPRSGLAVKEGVTVLNSPGTGRF